MDNLHQWLSLTSAAIGAIYGSAISRAFQTGDKDAQTPQPRICIPR